MAAALVNHVHAAYPIIVPKPYHLNVLLDPELAAALHHHVEQSGLESQSAAVRDLLRHALGVVSSKREAGWREGYNAAIAAVKRSMAEALHKIDAT